MAEREAPSSAAAPPPASEPSEAASTLRAGGAAPLRPAPRNPETSFLLPVGRLRRTLGSYRHVSCRGPIAGLASIGGAVVPDDADVVGELDCESLPGGISVTGVVTARWYGHCRRCAEDVWGEVSERVRERCTDAGGTEEDPDAYPLAGDELDLLPLLRDAVLLNLPLVPLCDDGCRGLCPICGVNRNEENCSCTAPADPRWDVLTSLRDPGTDGAAARVLREDRPPEQNEDVE